MPKSKTVTAPVKNDKLQIVMDAVVKAIAASESPAIPMAKLAEVTGFHERTVGQAIKTLELEEAIKVERRKGRNNPSIYTLNV